MLEDGPFDIGVDGGVRDGSRMARSCFEANAAKVPAGLVTTGPIGEPCSSSSDDCTYGGETFVC